MVSSQQQQLPEHVAVIMDGNGRWATDHHLPRAAGHKAGVKALRGTVEQCVAKDIDTLTVYAFSSENWRRPEKEVDLLMELFMISLQEEVKDLHRNNVLLQFIGERSAFPEKLQTAVAQAESLTEGNTGLNLFVAASYGGRWDIITACRKILDKIESGDISRNDLDEALMRRCLCLGESPEPDLFIRTGGEQRISNFLLWQLAYTELYFTDVLWPDFGARQFEEALAWFSTRQRRFGRTSEQIKRA
ncbi:MAG: polyprenyl diphosphate synthase [Gammaproteobacteria bacterium]